jgi:hypothetical protein
MFHSVTDDSGSNKLAQLSLNLRFFYNGNISKYLLYRASLEVRTTGLKTFGRIDKFIRKFFNGAND